MPNSIFVKNKYTLQIEDFFFKCVIGKNGTSKRKKEGDKKTPKGIYEIENLYYRKDRIKKIETKLKLIKIKKSMGWCDDVKNKKGVFKTLFLKKDGKILNDIILKEIKSLTQVDDW